MRRLLSWVLGGLALLVLLLALSFVLLLENLEHPAVKRRLLALVKEHAGLELDYEGLDVSLGRGVRARTLRVLTPPRFAEHADTFVRVQGLNVDTKLWALAFGERRVRSLRVERIDLALVQDASGASTLTELFPEGGEEEEKPASRLSQSLAELPELELDELSLGELTVRVVQLDREGKPSVLTASGLGLRGSVKSGERGLEGSNLVAAAEPLRVELVAPSRRASAALPFEARLSALASDALAFTLLASVAEQTFAPDWVTPGADPRAPTELLDIEGTARFDAPAGKTTLELARARAMDGTLAVAGQAEVFDAEGLRAVASGTTAVHIETLPPVLEGLVVEGLTLDIEASELSWDGTRVAGSLSARGGLRRAALGEGEAYSELGAATLSGEGRFDGGTGQLSGALRLDSIRASTPQATLTFGALALTLEGSAVERAGAQELTLGAVLGIDALNARATTGELVALERVKLDTQLESSAAQLAASSPRQVRVALTAARASAIAPGQRATLERPAATVRLDQVAPDEAAPYGLRGDAQLSMTLPSLRVLEGGAASAVLRALELRANAPLTLERASGALSIAALEAPPRALEALAFDFELVEPLGWAPERTGAPRAALRGRVERFDAGEGQGELESLALELTRPVPRRYALTLSANAGALSAGGAALPGRLVAELEADASLDAGTLKLASKLSGAGDAALDLGLDARFEHERGQLAYQASLAARKLEAFADFLAGVAPSTARLRLADSRLSARASGELSGVLHGAPGELPALVPEPLATLRGKQSMSLELASLDYRGAGRTLTIPELGFELSSEHAEGGAGQVAARLGAPSIELEGDGSSLRLRGLDYALDGRFDRRPDQGTVQLTSTLSLASGVQSYVPQYPLERVRATSRVEVARLRSILLRELELENGAAGTRLTARGALELLPTGTPASATITGREALALEGRLEQRLEPLESLGFAARARGTVAAPFRLESGGLLAYRLLATLEARGVSFADRERSLVIEGLNGVVPVSQEFVLLPTGPELSPGRRASPLAEPRFFDVHPFLEGDHYVTADRITLGNLQPLGPLAANVRLDRSDVLIDQLQVGFRGGQISGRLQLAYHPRDPRLSLRLNATGVRANDGEVLDANMALSFAPAALTLDGKVQLVRASRQHVLDLLDVLDPYHELVTANRVRGALAVGYPKFVRFHLHDGAVDSKVELGGLAGLVRIDEIRAVPLGPILQRYVAPSLEGWLAPRAPAASDEPRAATPVVPPRQARVGAPRGAAP